MYGHVFLVRMTAPTGLRSKFMEWAGAGWAKGKSEKGKTGQRALIGAMMPSKTFCPSVVIGVGSKNFFHTRGGN